MRTTDTNPLDKLLLWWSGSVEGLEKDLFNKVFEMNFVI
jgi:hypothetical protein